MPTICPAISVKMNTNDRMREDGDVAAGHVRRKSHGERERPHQHAQNLDRDQRHRERRRAHRAAPGSSSARSRRAPSSPATMMAKKLIMASCGVTLKFEVAVEPPCSTMPRKDSSLKWKHVVVEQREHLEDRNHADRVGAEDEHEERQQQRRPRVVHFGADGSARRRCRG